MLSNLRSAAHRSQRLVWPVYLSSLELILLNPGAELHTLREMLMQKYGRDFALAASENRDSCVSERVGLLRTSVLQQNLLNMWI
jgi:hypothetical protein